MIYNSSFVNISRDKMNEKIKVFNRDQIKYIAALLMFIGHFMIFTVKELNYLGLPSVIVKPLILFQYIAPFVFMFFIAEGFYYTKNLKKYVARLLTTGIVTQFTFVLANTGSMDWNMFLTTGNIVLTLLLSLLILIIYDSSRINIIFKIMMIMLCLGITYVWNMEWAIIAPLIVFVFYILRDKPVWRFVSYEILMIGYVLISMGGFEALISKVLFILVIQVPIIIITFFYNGQEGRFPVFSKYFFYLFYPVHMMIIFMIKVIIR